MIIFSPANISPAKVNELTAQIDIAPTIFGLLNFNYKSKFFGQDALNTPPEKRRAYISTYEGLGYIKNGKLIIQSPVKKINQFTPDFITGSAEHSKLNDTLANEATSFYQAASWLIKNHRYNK